VGTQKIKSLKKEEAFLAQCGPVSQVMKSLAHPVRLRILCQILDREMRVSELVESCQISQSAISQFLNRMRSEGILASRREGNGTYYKVSDPKLARLLKAMKEIYCG
jgi:ArsR family transcriptional regulator